MHLEDVQVNKVVAQGHVGSITYTVRKVRDRRFKRLALDQSNFDIKFKVEEEGKHHKKLLKDSYLAIEKALKLVHNFLMAEYKGTPHCGVQFSLMHEGLEKGSINMALVPLNDLSAVDDLMYALQEVNQSNKSLALDETLRISVIINKVMPVKSKEREEQVRQERQQRKKGKKKIRLGAVGNARDGQGRNTNDNGGSDDDGSSSSNNNNNSNIGSSNNNSNRGSGDDESNSSSSSNNNSDGDSDREQETRGRENKVVLGPDFRDNLYKSNKPSMKMVPEFKTGPLRDCCLLVAIVLGLKHAEEMAEHAHKENVGKFPTSPSWRKLSQCWRKDRTRARSACQFLEKEVLSFCEKYDIDPTKFRLVDPEEVREEISKMPLNLLIYDSDANFEVVFMEPAISDKAKPTVSVLTKTNPITQLDHAGVIIRPDRFFSSKGRKRCLDCKETFISR